MKLFPQDFLNVTDPKYPNEKRFTLDDEGSKELIYALGPNGPGLYIRCKALIKVLYREETYTLVDFRKEDARMVCFETPEDINIYLINNPA